jgi:hypothetical protein
MLNISSAVADEKPTLDTAAIEAASGLKATFNKQENVFKVSKPRADVHVRVDGLQMAPFMGLTSWAAFTPGHGAAMLMGDTVLFQDEVNPVMSVALNNHHVLVNGDDIAMSFASDWVRVVRSTCRAFLAGGISCRCSEREDKR